MEPYDSLGGHRHRCMSCGVGYASVGELFVVVHLFKDRVSLLVVEVAGDLITANGEGGHT